MIRRLLALCLLCCLGVSAAQASSVVPVSVKLSGFTRPAQVGVPISVDIVIGSGQTLMLQSFSVTPTGGATGFTHNAPTIPYFITAQGTRTIRVSFTPTTDTAGVAISFTAGTDRIRRTFDLSAENYGRLTTPRGVLSLPGEIVMRALDRGESNFLPLLGGACFLAAGYRIPLAGMLMVAEATGSLTLTVIGLFAVATAQVMMGENSVSDAKRDTRDAGGAT